MCTTTQTWNQLLEIVTVNPGVCGMMALEKEILVLYCQPSQALIEAARRHPSHGWQIHLWTEYECTRGRQPLKFICEAEKKRGIGHIPIPDKLEERISVAETSHACITNTQAIGQTPVTWNSPQSDPLLSKGIQSKKIKNTIWRSTRCPAHVSFSCPFFRFLIASCQWSVEGKSLLKPKENESDSWQICI